MLQNCIKFVNSSNILLIVFINACRYDVSDKNDNSVTLSPKNAKLVKAVIKKGAPFTIEFYYNNELQSIFDAKRFVMKNVSIRNLSQS